MATLPAPIRAYLGLLATAVDAAQQLIERAPDPVEAVGNTLQLSMRMQQRYAELVTRGDELISHLRGAPEQPPEWATFDEAAASPSDVLAEDPHSAVRVSDIQVSEGFDSAGDGLIEGVSRQAGAGARFDADLHDEQARASGTPLVAQGDALASDLSVIALPAKAPMRTAADAVTPMSPDPLLPAVPPEVLPAPAATKAPAKAPAAKKTAAARTRTTRSPEAASPEAVSPEAVSPEAVSPEAVSPEAASPGAAAPAPRRRSAFDTVADAISTTDDEGAGPPAS